MITYGSLISDMKDEGFTIVRENITSPEHPVNDVLRNLSGPVEMHDEPLVVQYMSEYVKSGSSPDCLYVLVPDNAFYASHIPDSDNWVIVSASTNIMLLIKYVRRKMIISRRLDTATIRLSRSFMYSDSMQELLETAEDVLGNSIFLSDNSTKVLFWSDRDKFVGFDDELIRAVLEYGFVPTDLYDKYDYPNYLAMIGESEGAFLRTSTYPDKSDRIIAKLTVNGVYFGWLVAVPNKRPFDDSDCSIMDIIARMATMTLEKHGTVLPYDFRENLLNELMSGQIEEEIEFWARAKCFKWDKKDDYRVLLMGFRGSRPLQEERIVLQMKRHLALLFPKNDIISVRNKLCMLLETDEIDNNMVQIRPFLRHYKLDIAVSECFHQIIEFRSNVEDALDYLLIGPMMHPDQNEFYYNDMEAYSLIARMCDPDRLASEYAPEWAALDMFDARQGTEYVKTLKTYISCRNTVAAAAELHIHRNTMNYRLQKIQEITGCDVEAGDNLYKLWLSGMMYDITRLKREMKYL